MEYQHRSSSLVTLAMLKVNYDMRKSYVDTFLPFVLDSFTNDDLLSIETIQNEVLGKYKLKIPLNSLTTILKRAQRKGLIAERNDCYYINESEVQSLTNEKLRNEALRQHRQLVQTLIDFCAAEFNVPLSFSEAENALFGFIRYRDVELLRSTVFGSPFADQTVPSKEINFYTGRFITSISNSDQSTFDLLASFVKAYMLSELLIFENISDIDKPFGSIDFYLDTQLAIRTLGYTYPLLARAAGELKSLLGEEGGNLYVFEHTLDEIAGILEACENALLCHNFKVMGEVSRYIIDNRVSPSDLRMIITSLDRILYEHNIEIRPVPPHVPEYEIGEKELVEYLNQNYRYRNPLARDRDVDSISAMYRLRKGGKPTSIRNCKTVFITTNANLAKHTYSFLYKEQRYTHFPLLITDHLATNLLWARKPDKYDNISKNQLLADALVLINPNNNIWEKYFNELEKLRMQGRLTDEEALLLLWSSEVQAAIMDITHGGKIEPSEKNIFDIIMRARKRITSSERIEIEKLQEEIASYKKQTEQTQSQDREIEKLKQELQKQKEMQELTVKNIQSKISLIANVTAWILISIPAALIFLALFNLTPYPLGYIAVGILALLSFLNLLMGTTLFKFKYKAENFIKRKLKDMFMK